MNSPAGTARAAETAHREHFAIDVQRRQRVAIVQPRGELELATVEPLQSAVDAAIAEILNAAGGVAHDVRVVLDLRGLSFIDSTGVQLLVMLDQRAQRDGFQLTLVAPAPPADRAIRLCGLDRRLSFVAPVDAVDTEPREPAPVDRATARSPVGA